VSTHILHTPMEEIARNVDGSPRWCFRCRRVQTFESVVSAPIVSCWCPIDGPRRDDGDGIVEFSTGAWYGPSQHVECTGCRQMDGDCFPGTYREWDD
jgi:hypothetical protein